jgi:mycothiol synthase
LPEIHYRHPQETDLPNITRIWNDSMRELPLHRTLTVEEMRAETFADEDFDPEGAWLAIKGDELVGYGDGLLEKERISLGREGLARIEVVHHERGKGVEERLLDLALRYLARKGFQAVQVWCSQVDHWRREFSRKAGFEEQRRFYSMILKDGQDVPRPAFPQDVRIDRRPLRGASDDDLKTFVEVFNESFAGHFSFSPTNVTRWRNVADTAEDEMDITFAYQGDRVTGFALVENSTAFNREKGTRDGWVNILGVVPSSRGKGLGKALLLDSIQQLQAQGLDTIRLGLDAENRNALSLYTSVGFEVLMENTVLVRDLKDKREG